MIRQPATDTRLRSSDTREPTSLNVERRDFRISTASRIMLYQCMRNSRCGQSNDVIANRLVEASIELTDRVAATVDRIQMRRLDYSIWAADRYGSATKNVSSSSPIASTHPFAARFETPKLTLSTVAQVTYYERLPIAPLSNVAQIGSVGGKCRMRELRRTRENSGRQICVTCVSLARQQQTTGSPAKNVPEVATQDPYRHRAILAIQARAVHAYPGTAARPHRTGRLMTSESIHCAE
jgi:hypothetical protein